MSDFQAKGSPILSKCWSHQYMDRLNGGYGSFFRIVNHCILVKPHLGCQIHFLFKGIDRLYLINILWDNYKTYWISTPSLFYFQKATSNTASLSATITIFEYFFDTPFRAALSFVNSNYLQALSLGGSEFENAFNDRNQGIIYLRLMNSKRKWIAEDHIMLWPYYVRALMASAASAAFPLEGIAFWLCLVSSTRNTSTTCSKNAVAMHLQYHLLTKTVSKSPTSVLNLQY